MKLLIFFIILLITVNKAEDPLLFKTTSGNVIMVSNGIIYYDNKPISNLVEGVVYTGKYNRIIEQNSSLFLFLEINNSPDYNSLKAFKLTREKAVEIVDCVYNDAMQGIGPPPFNDIDNDHYEEFGGFAFTEVYNSEDSMYYNPSQYYKIKNGEILFDSSLTKKMDANINGIYLPNPLDKNGNCCLVIRKSTK